MRTADIEVGQTYFAAPETTYSGERWLVQVVAVGVRRQPKGYTATPRNDGVEVHVLRSLHGNAAAKMILRPQQIIRPQTLEEWERARALDAEHRANRERERERMNELIARATSLGLAADFERRGRIGLPVDDFERMLTVFEASA